MGSWSIDPKDLIILYCGSLFVEHYTAVDLVEHYEEFVKQLDIDSKFLLRFGMDRPNVNFSFLDKHTEVVWGEYMLLQAGIMFTSSSSLCISEGD